MANKKVVIIGANEFQNRLILKAKSLGYETHVFAWESGDIGETTADFFYPISITDKEQILEQCRLIHPDAVCSIASDLAVLTVNYLAENLNLPGNPTSISEQCTNKYLMRSTLQKHHIKTPWFIKTNTSTPHSDISPHLPVIVKPTDRSGSRGITKVSSLDQLSTALASAQSESFEHSAIIEEFIDGNEYSCECITQNGEHHFLAFTKKYTTGAPNFIETGHCEPSDLDPELQKIIQSEISNALSALGIQNGASHTEFKIDASDNFGIIEIGARMGGDCIGSDLVELSTGYDFLKMVLDVALGLPLDIQQYPTTDNYSFIKFILSQDDLNQINRVNELHPDSLRHQSPISNFDHAVKDSSTRFGFAIYATDNIIQAKKIKNILFSPPLTKQNNNISTEEKHD